MVNLVHVKNFNSQNDNTMAEVKFEDLLGTGAHFGHVTRKWDPNFQPYILLEKNHIKCQNGQIL